MAHTEQKLINGVLTDVTVFDSSAQEIDDAAAKGLWLANRNLLDNAYFINPVNQKGLTEYSGAVYGIDRWCGNSSAVTATLTDSGLMISASGGIGFYRQFLESPELLYGKVVTISVLLSDGTFFSETGTVPAAAGTSNTTVCMAKINGSVVYLVFLMDSSGRLMAQFRLGDGYSLNVMACKLEFGPNQTLAHQNADGNWALNDPPPNKAAELARCKRYFVSLRGDRTANYANFGMGVATSATQAYFLIPLETQMRISPSVTFSGSMRLSVNGGASTIAVTKITSGGQETAGVCRLSATVASGLTQGDVCVLQANNDTTADIWLDANL